MKKENLDKKKFRNWCITALVLWTVLVAASLYQSRENELHNAINTGKKIGHFAIQKDYIYRAWNAAHGGVYVPVTDETTANPYLNHIPDRDISTIKGEKFTLINPAYMTRQVHVLGQEMFGIHGHITSLNPIRTENKPDQWETKALQQFEDETKTVSELVTMNNQLFMRVMTPMKTREPCLKCHASQGYKLGDIHGGISVSVPMQEILTHTKQHILRNSLYHFSIFLIGIIGLFIFYLQTCKQLVKRTEAEKKLLQKTEEWEKTFNAIPDIITLQDTNRRIVQANKATYDFFQINDKTLIGKKCYELFTGKSEPCSGCPGLTTFQNTQDHSAIIIHEELGKIFQVTSSPILSENKEVEYFVHVTKDITEQKQLEEDLLQAHKMKAIGTLAGGIAHDFNNILSVIIGYAEIVKNEIQNGTGRPDKNIEQVLTASKRATELVKQILTFSHKSKHHVQPLSPYLIVNEALKMLRASLPATISIQQDIDTECGEILADPTKIHQVVVNLCTNAVHAMENEKGTLSISLSRKTIRPEQIKKSDVSPGDFIVLSVRDTGQGMDQEMIKLIFEPYYTTKIKGKGTGLGLAVIHGIIKEYKGFIKVESETTKGSSFHIHIPALEKDSFVKISTAGKDGPLPTGTEHILLVDDENAIVDIIKTELERQGYTVTATTDSLDALEKISENPDQYDLIITDQTMPNMTGYELAQKALRIKPDMLIILLTGYSAVISENDALAIGIKKFAKKPISREKLTNVVRQVLDENLD